jgi:hypothetical protein
MWIWNTDMVRCRHLVRQMASLRAGRDMRLPPKSGADCYEA